MLLWLCLLCRWSLEAQAMSGVRASRRTKMWTILSSPKCHKVGRAQLALREACYSVDFELWPATAAGSLEAAVALWRLLADISAGCDHGLLKLQRVTARLRCALHTFEAFRW